MQSVSLHTSSLVRLSSLNDNGVRIVEGLNLCAAPRNDLSLLDLEHAIDNSRVRICALDEPQIAFEFFAILHILNIHVLQQLLSHFARHLILIVKAGRDAEVQWFFRFFLSGSLFEATAFTS